MAWLAEILRNGTLLDNQIYYARNGQLENRRLPEPITLDRAQRRTKAEHDEGAVWQFLLRTAQEVSESMQRRTVESVVLFNDSDYEHNTADQFIEVTGTNAFDFSLTTGNLIGYVKRDKYALKISSRFGDAFLRYIIADADGFLEIEDFGGQEPGGDYDWLLAYLWMIKLKRAFRLGLPKAYVGKSETTYRVRGKLDPTSYFLDRDRNAFKCSYREHSYCNSQTSLIAEAFHALRKHDLLRDVHTVASNFTIAAEGKRLSRRELLATRLFTNPFYSDYNAVIDLSKRALRRESTDFAEQSDTSAFFFDIAMLFEYFIRKLLKRAGARLQPKVPSNWTIPSGGLHQPVRKLEPDLVFDLEQTTCVFDVKYKSYDFGAGVSREDLFQLHTYVGQCSNTENVGACGLIYPVTERHWHEHGLDRKGGRIDDVLRMHGRRIRFYVCFIRVPSAAGRFIEMFRESSAAFVNGLREATLA